MTARSRWALLAVTASLLLLAGCGGDDGLTGTITAVQDVEGLPDVPVTAGWVAAVPAASADELWTAGGLPRPPDDQLRYATGRLSRSAVERAGGVVGAVDDGRFALPAVEGEHLLCLLQDEGAGEFVSGCAAADLPTSGGLALTVGEAGLQVEG